MSVVGSFRIDIRPYSAYDDPSLPVASWIAQAGIAGDASGGTVLVDFLFQEEAQPISELFNLEQIAVDTDANATDEYLIQTRGMDSLAPDRPASPQKWQAQTNSLLATESATSLHEEIGLPLWLGSPNNRDSTGALRFVFVNTDLRLFAVTVQGYMWGPRSILAQGGPRRPVGGLFKG